MPSAANSDSESESGARPGSRLSCRGRGARFSAGFRADAGAMLCRSVGAEYRFGYFSRRIRGLHRELRTEVQANVCGACLRAEVSRNGGPPEKIGIHGSTGLLVWQVSARTAFAALSPRYDGMGGFCKFASDFLLFIFNFVRLRHTIFGAGCVCPAKYRFCL